MTRPRRATASWWKPWRPEASGFLGKDEAAQELLSAAKAAADGEVLIDPATLTRLLAAGRARNEKPSATPRTCSTI